MTETAQRLEPPALSALRIEHFRGAAEEWDDFVRAQRGATHAHRYGWRRVVQAALGHECRYLCARDATGALDGVLPLVRVRSRLLGHYLVSMPVLDSGGPLGSADAVRALASHAVCLARRDGVRLLELRCRVEQPLDLPASSRGHATVLDVVPHDPAGTVERLPASLRDRIRRARQAGVTVRIGTEQTASFHDTYSRQMGALGAPVHGRRLYAAIAATFPEDSCFACAYVDGRAVACAAGLLWNGELAITWASAPGEPDTREADAALFAALVERAAVAGCRVVDFGRGAQGNRMREIARQSGARDEARPWYVFSLAGDAATAPWPADADRVCGAYLWKRLPLALTRVLGPRIARLVP